MSMNDENCASAQMLVDFLAGFCAVSDLFPCRLLVRKNRCAQGSLPGPGLPAAGPYTEWSIGQCCGGGLHHTTTRGVPPWTGPVCPTAVGCWSPGEPATRVPAGRGTSVFACLINLSVPWCTVGGCEERRRQHPAVWCLLGWKFGVCEAPAGARRQGQPRPHLSHCLPSSRSLHGRWIQNHGPTLYQSITFYATNLYKTERLVLLLGNSDCVKLLITMGACLESYDLYYGTPLHVACVNEHTDCAKVLLNAGGYQCMLCSFKEASNIWVSVTE